MARLSGSRQGNSFYTMLVTLLLVGGSAGHLTPDARVRTQRPEIVLDRYERWTLYWGGQPGRPNKSALLVLFVRNTTDRLVADWRALLVTRDSTGREMFRLAIERDSADLEPGEVQRVEFRFDNDLRVDGEPYDHLMRTDTTNIFVSFDEVLVSVGPPVRHARAGRPVCYDRSAFDLLAAARARGDTSFTQRQWWRERCQLLSGETSVVLLEAVGSTGWRVRFKGTTRTAWLLAADLLEQSSPDAR
jgi:hypothetical protein